MSEKKRHCLFIIDGHSLLYKSYYAIRGLSTRSGIPTNAIFGFAQMLLRIIREAEPRYLCFTFDSKTPSFRRELYPEYKANRAVMPDDLQGQIPYVFRMLDAFRIGYIIQEGFEADDLIATLSHQAEEKGWETKVVTADKDLFQIVNDRTHILRFGPKEIEEFDPESVWKKMGVQPEQITDYFGLTGDASDNIPGVAGIGPVTASKLLKEFKTLDEVIDKADSIKNAKAQQKIKENINQARLSRQLATVIRDVPINFDLHDFAINMEITPELESLFNELEFKALLTSLKNTGEEQIKAKRTVQYKIIRTHEELKEYVLKAQDASILSVDTETTSPDPMRCRLVGISLSCAPGEAVYIPLSHKETAAEGRQISLDEATALLAPLFKSNDIKKCGHNIKYDIHVLHRVGLNLGNIAFDTILASYLLNPDKASHGLKTIVPEELGIFMEPITNLIGKGKTSITFDHVPMSKAAEYACRDADVTLELMSHFQKQLAKVHLDHLFHEIEVPLIPVLEDMESRGIAIDTAHFEMLSRKTQVHLKQLEKECHELVGYDFNLNSPKQISKVLFEDLKLTPTKKGKTGYSTDVTVLEALSQNHPLPGKLLTYRIFEKLLSTYIDVLPRLVHPETGRIHTTFIQTGTATGRLASRDPNLQNIPVRTPEGRAIRAGFIPGEKGWVLVSGDYSQIELRILAHISGDKTLIRAFQEDKDIHNLTATKIFGGIEEWITPEMRDIAKTINFGVIYGMSAYRLATELGITRSEAGKFIDDYFKTYQGVKNWIDHIIQEARTAGYVRTLSGRLRYIPDLKNSNRNIRAAAERIAINTPIQGACADMIKIAMISIHNRFNLENIESRLLLQVHDELIFEVPEREIDRISSIITEEMEQALPLDVPVKVGVKIGSNWSEC
jgi:DNA polymerase-1